MALAKYLEDNIEITVERMWLRETKAHPAVENDFSGKLITLPRPAGESAYWEQDVPERPYDKALVCRDCRKLFVFTVGEQAWFSQRGFCAPRRCKACRAARKASKEV